MGGMIMKLSDIKPGASLYHQQGRLSSKWRADGVEFVVLAVDADGAASRRGGALAVRGRFVGREYDENGYSIVSPRELHGDYAEIKASLDAEFAAIQLAMATRAAINGERNDRVRSASAAIAVAGAASRVRIIYGAGQSYKDPNRYGLEFDMEQAEKLAAFIGRAVAAGIQ